MMKKTHFKKEERKLITQIARIFEKQYRKGFQQGFKSANNNELSCDKVDSFRFEGSRQGYRKYKDIHTGESGGINHILERLQSELMMKDTEELRHLIYKYLKN